MSTSQSAIELIINGRDNARGAFDSVAKGVEAVKDAAKLSGQSLIDFQGGLNQSARSAVEAQANVVILTRGVADLRKELLDAAQAGKAGSFAAINEQIEQALPKLKAAQEELKKFNTPPDESGGGLTGWFSKLGTEVATQAAGFITAQAAIAGVTGAVRLVVGEISASVKAASDAEAAQTKLTAAMRQQSTYTPELVKQYNDLATATQENTRYSDDLTNEMEALLVQVGNIMPSQMKGALQASTDLAAGLGIDLRSATMLVAKAAEGHTETLGRYGIQVSASALKSEGFEAVLSAVNRQFGGQAAAAVDTYAGKVDQLGNAWNNVQEAIGRKIILDPLVLATIERLTPAANDAGTAIDRNEGATSRWNTALKNVGVVIVQELIPGGGAFGNVLDQLKERWNAAEEAAAEYVAQAKATRQGAADWTTYTQSIIGVSDAQKVLAAGMAESNRLHKEEADAKKKAEDAARKHAEAITTEIQSLTGEKAAYTVTFDAIHQMIAAGNLDIDTKKRIVDALDKIHAANGVIPGDLEAWRQGNETLGTSYEKLAAGAAQHIEELNKKQTADFEKTLKQESEDLLKQLKGDNDERDKARKANQSAENRIGGELQKEIEHTSLSTFAFQAAQLLHWQDLQEGTLNYTVDGWEKAYGEIGQYVKLKLQEINDEEELAAEDVIAKYNHGVMTARKGTMDWVDDIGKVATELQHLAQVSQGTFGAIIQELANVVSEVGNAAASWKAFGAQTTTTGKVGVAASAGVDVLAATGPNANQGTGKGQAEGAAAGAVSGLVAGAEIGSFAGPGGAAVGAAVGAIAGAIIGFVRNLGPSAAEKSGRQVEGDFEKQYGGFSGLQAATVSAYEDTGRSAKDANADLLAMFAEEEQGADATAAAVAKINAVIQQQADFGKDGEAALQGLTAQFSTANSAYDTVNADIVALDGLQKQLAAEPVGSDKYKELQKQIAAVTLEMNQQAAVADGTAIKTQNEATAMGAALAGAIDLEIKSGKSFSDAIRDNIGAIDTLKRSITAAGFSGGAAFDLLTRQADLLKDPIAGPILTAVQNLSGGFHGLAASGTETKEEFQGFGEQVKQALDTLEAQGQSAPDIMVAMQGPLQELWQEEEQYHFKLDDATQALLDQAVASGEVGEKHKSTTDQMLDAENKLVDIMGTFVKAMGVDLPNAVESGAATARSSISGIGRVISDLPTSRTFVFKTDYESEGQPPPQPPPLPGAAGGIYATGRSGVATWFGEGGEPEVGGPADFFERIFTKMAATAPARSGASAQAPGTVVHLTMHVDGVFSEGDLTTSVQRKMLPLIIDALDNNVAGQRTQARDVLGIR